MRVRTTVLITILLVTAQTCSAQAGWLSSWFEPKRQVDNYGFVPGLTAEIAPGTTLTYIGIANGPPARVFATLDNGTKQKVELSLGGETDVTTADGTTCRIFVRTGNNMESDMEVTCPAP